MKTARVDDVTEDMFTNEPSALTAWASTTRSGKQKTKARPKTVAASSFQKTIAETKAMIEAADWEGANLRHVHALYALMHEKVYGFEPAATPKERHVELMRLANFVKREFTDNIDAAIDFCRWMWTREISRVKWRAENSREPTRLNFGATISTWMLNDYRAFVVEKSRRRT